MAFMLNSPCGCCSPAFQADYLVFIYNFLAGSGTDLDTRTAITSPFAGPSLGYCQPNTANPYLFWGGDNTGTGVESCYADVAAVKAAYPAATFLDVALHAVWYGARGTGNTNMVINAYKGGVMSHVGFGFVNTGGTLTATLSFPKNVVTNTTACVLGDSYGTAHYVFATGVLTMI